MSLNFSKYNIIVVITFALSYILLTFFVDVMNLPLWLVMIPLSIIIHFLRYIFITMFNGEKEFKCPNCGCIPSELVER